MKVPNDCLPASGCLPERSLVDAHSALLCASETCSRRRETEKKSQLPWFRAKGWVKECEMRRKREATDGQRLGFMSVAAARVDAFFCCRRATAGFRLDDPQHGQVSRVHKELVAPRRRRSSLFGCLACSRGETLSERIVPVSYLT